MTFISIGLRLRVEVEALNMVEALGAYTRHRTTSVFKRLAKDGNVRYKLVTVPAVSGQSIANGYMRTVVELAKRYELKICKECSDYERRGGFIKHSTEPKASGKTHDTLVKDCVLEDLTGFLAPEIGIRRTSPVMFSYMVPDIESAKAVIDPQFHVRYDFITQQHQPFNIESGSAIYMVMINIDAARIGMLEETSEKTETGSPKKNYVGDRDKRLEVALRGIAALFEGLGFGAKKARYLPIEEVVGGVAAVSKPLPFTISPPRIYANGDNYINNTINRALKYLEVLKDLKEPETISIAYFDKEGLKVESGSEITQKITLTKTESLSDLIEKTLTTAKNYLGLGTK